MARFVERSDLRLLLRNSGRSEIGPYLEPQLDQRGLVPISGSRFGVVRMI